MAQMTYDIDRDRRDLDVSKRIARLVPDEAPFAVMLLRARKRRTRSSEKIWYDSAPAAWWTQVNNGAGYASGVTDIVVDDASIFYVKDVIKFTRTGEIAYVSAIDTGTNTLTVVRGYGTTAAAALLDNDYIMRLPNAMEENSLAPASRGNQPAKLNNYVQTIRTPFDESMESEEEALETSESERNRLRRDYLLEHRLELERAVLFGEKKEDTANKRRMMGGLYSYILSNSYDAGGTLTEAKLETFLQMLFAYGSKRKLLVTSHAVAGAIGQIAQGKIQVRSGADTYGVAIAEYLSFHGRLAIVASQTFENDYAGLGIGVDMKNVSFFTKGNHSSQLRTNIQENDRDGWKDEYMTRATLEVRLEKTHALLENAV